MRMLAFFSVAALGGALVLNAVAESVPDAQAEDESPANIIAVQIRKQGFSCEKPQSASRDAKSSGPDEPVWIVKCDNASYRVRLVGNMADRVEKLSESKTDSSTPGVSR
jgi:hypothetical protein